MMGLGHTANVENSSTPRKLFSREPLNILARVRSLHSLPMRTTVEKREVGNRLRLAREALGFGLREMGRKYDDDPSKISHWEKGQHFPDLNYVRWLWENHAITADWIYLGRIAGLPHGVAVSLQEVERAFAKVEPWAGKGQASGGEHF